MTEFDMSKPLTAPLILTAAIDPAAATVFQAMRDRYFPPRLNIVPAHLTLFHHLPGLELTSVEATLRSTCDGERPIPFTTGGLRFLGRGVALEIEATMLVTLRQRLAAEWHPWLSAQDRQRFCPHVTIQNKVDPRDARALRDQLIVTPPDVNGAILGLDLWHYRGGPWERAGRFAFGSD